jgi:hypothetical protein
MKPYYTHTRENSMDEANKPIDHSAHMH